LRDGIVLRPLLDDLHNFPHVGALALSWTGAYFAAMQTKPGTFFGSGEMFSENRTLIKAGEGFHLYGQSGFTIVIEQN
jgi:hypothetical protein